MYICGSVYRCLLLAQSKFWMISSFTLHLPFCPPPLLSLSNSLLHLSCNFVCQLECQISQSACVLCHFQGHEDESAVSWCQPEGLGLQPNGGRTQRVQVGQQLPFTHYDTENNLTSFVFFSNFSHDLTCKHNLTTDAFVESNLQHNLLFRDCLSLQ